jgi:uncharacterized protein YkwD
MLHRGEPMRRLWTCAGALVAVCLLAFAAAAVPGETAGPLPNRTELTRTYALPYRLAGVPASATMETAMLALINRSRRAAGLDSLKASTPLRTVARRHGSDMFSNGYFSHESQDGRFPLDRVQAAGLFPWHVGENLAYAPDVETAHHRLMNSPGHRENILSPVFRWIGVGIMDGGRRGVMVVEDFTD